MNWRTTVVSNLMTHPIWLFDLRNTGIYYENGVPRSNLFLVLLAPVWGEGGEGHSPPNKVIWGTLTQKLCTDCPLPALKKTLYRLRQKTIIGIAAKCAKGFLTWYHRQNKGCSFIYTGAIDPVVITDTGTVFIKNEILFIKKNINVAKAHVRLK
jgi:hypothetical protein